jgi:hypothetical protein
MILYYKIQLFTVFLKQVGKYILFSVKYLQILGVHLRLDTEWSNLATAIVNRLVHHNLPQQIRLIAKICVSINS